MMPVRFTLAFLCALSVLLVAVAPASAWEVRVSIVGSGLADETTEADLLYCSSSQDTPNGTIGATCLAGTHTGDYGHGWTVRYVATASDGWRFLRWQSDGSSRQAVVCDGANGSSTYTGSACQFGTYNNLQTQAVFEDIQAPVPSITGGPVAGSTSGRSVSFSFTATNNPGQTTNYLCRLEGPAGVVQDWTTCTSGKGYTSLADGGHTFKVSASDPSRLWNVTSRSWNVDAVAPETWLTDGPTAGSTVSARTATFQFTGSGDPERFMCKVDAGAVVDPCTSPYTTAELADGTHTFSVWGRDARGNVEDSPATRAWNIDTQAPELAFTSGPAEGSTSTSSTARFEFMTNGSTLECSHNSAPYAACTSPVELSGLTSRAHSFSVRARDAVNNTTTITRSWTVALPAASNTGSGGVVTVGGGDALAGFSPAVATPVDATPGSVSVRATAPSAIVRPNARGVVPVASVVCQEASGLTCAVAATTKSAAKVVRTRAGRKQVAFGVVRRQLAGGTSAKLTLRLTKPQKALLVRLRSIKIITTVVVVDSSGNSRTITVRSTLKAPRTARR